MVACEGSPGILVATRGIKLIYKEQIKKKIKSKLKYKIYSPKVRAKLENLYLKITIYII